MLSGFSESRFHGAEHAGLYTPATLGTDEVVVASTRIQDQSTADRSARSVTSVRLIPVAAHPKSP